MGDESGSGETPASGESPSQESPSIPSESVGLSPPAGEEFKDSDSIKPLSKDFKSKTSVLRKPSRMVSKMMTSRVSLKESNRTSRISQRSLFSTSSIAIKRQSEVDRAAFKGPRYQNTYRLDSKFPFKPDEVYKVIVSIVEREVAGVPRYDPISATRMAQTIAAQVRNSVKLFNYDRYKICVLVYVGQKKLQGFQAAFRCLWDSERDGWSSYFYQTRTYFLCCTCYGLYHD